MVWFRNSLVLIPVRSKLRCRSGKRKPKKPQSNKWGEVGCGMQMQMRPSNAEHSFTKDADGDEQDRTHTHSNQGTLPNL